MKPTIALVGRPNVGKSTLFNRLTRSRDALVADFSGLTRDRHYGVGRIGHKPYILVDTGGFEPLIDSGVMYEMLRQAEQAIFSLLQLELLLHLVNLKPSTLTQPKWVLYCDQQ